MWQTALHSGAAIAVRETSWLCATAAAQGGAGVPSLGPAGEELHLEDGTCVLNEERGAPRACSAGRACAWGARVCPGDSV